MSSNDNHLRVQSVLVRYFQKLDPKIKIENTEDDDGAVLHFGAVNTDIGLIRFGSWVQNKPERMVFYVYHPIQILFSARQAVMELVTRMNYGLSWGCFELDMNDGELRFRVGLHMDGSQIDRRLVHNAIHHGFSTLLYYHGAVSTLLYDNLTPEHALQITESTGNEDSPTVEEVQRHEDDQGSGTN
jgi:hypothetical protein